jgi:CheY-like chemotaxis protein
VQLRSRKATQHIPIVLCTDHPISENEKPKGFQPGVDDYLIRPFDLTALGSRLDAILRRAAPQLSAEVLAGISALLKTPSQEPPPVPPEISASLPIDSASSSPIVVMQVTSTEMAAVAATTSLSMSESSVVTRSEPRPFNPFRRMAQVLHHPRRAFETANPHQDMLVSMVLILGTPMIASLAPFSPTGTVAWLTGLGLKLVTHIGAWIVIAAAVYVAVPFLGKRWSIKQALAVTGLAWAPRAVEAILSTLYTFLAPLYLARVTPFSGGLDLLPVFSGAKLNPVLAGVNLFSIWSAALVLIAVWTLCKVKHRWNSITVAIGLIALLIGVFTHV